MQKKDGWVHAIWSPNQLRLDLVETTTVMGSTKCKQTLRTFISGEFRLSSIPPPGKGLCFVAGWDCKWLKEWVPCRITHVTIICVPFSYGFSSPFCGTNRFWAHCHYGIIYVCSFWKSFGLIRLFWMDPISWFLFGKKKQLDPISCSCLVDEYLHSTWITINPYL